MGALVRCKRHLPPNTRRPASRGKGSDCVIGHANRIGASWAALGGSLRGSWSSAAYSPYSTTAAAAVVARAHQAPTVAGTATSWPRALPTLEYHFAARLVRKRKIPRDRCASSAAAVQQRGRASGAGIISVVHIRRLPCHCSERHRARFRRRPPPSLDDTGDGQMSRELNRSTPAAPVLSSLACRPPDDAAPACACYRVVPGQPSQPAGLRQRQRLGPWRSIVASSCTLPVSSQSVARALSLSLSPSVDCLRRLHRNVRPTFPSFVRVNRSTPLCSRAPCCESSRPPFTAPTGLTVARWVACLAYRTKPR